MSFVRILIIALLMICGAFFLAMGLDVPIPHLAWQASPGRDVAIGLVLVFAGIAVARFWTIPLDENKVMDDWKRSRKNPR